MSAAPIYVVVSSDDLSEPWLSQALARDPSRKPSPIVHETQVSTATLEEARRRAADLESQYGACRVGRVVFEDEPGFEVKA